MKTWAARSVEGPLPSLSVGSALCALGMTSPGCESAAATNGQMNHHRWRQRQTRYYLLSAPPKIECSAVATLPPPFSWGATRGQSAACLLVRFHARALVSETRLQLQL
jgi:hypothetical protein